jgi:ribosomal-protein-alanine N-acetyltransferase
VSRTGKPRVLIRPPGPEDCLNFLAAVRRSRSFHHPWVSPPSTAKAFENYLERLTSGAHCGFLVIHQDGQLAGVINLNNVIRGAFHSAFLGYYAFSPMAGQGLMREGMLLVIRRAFTVLKLHRLEANVQPKNHRSIALVRKCGFVREGFSRRYLKVDGRWRDHERWAILRDP